MAPKKGKLSQLLAKKEFVFCGEGYLFELERRGYVTVGPFVPTVVLDHPDAVLQLHREFARCGSDVIQAFTYYGHKSKLDVVGRGHDVVELNRKAIRLARQVADEFPGTLVAGNISNSTHWSLTDKEAQKVVLEDMKVQLDVAKEEGVDFVIVETMDAFSEAEAAQKLVLEYGFECVTTLNAKNRDISVDGMRIADGCVKLARDGATVVGVNCQRGPFGTLPLVEEAVKKLRAEGLNTPVGIVPGFYKTTAEKPTFYMLSDPKKIYMELEPYVMTRFDTAKWAQQCKEIGAQYLGTCCGGAPYHIRAMAEALGYKPEASKNSADVKNHWTWREDQPNWYKM